jgi:uncharacterized membrane protein
MAIRLAFLECDNSNRGFVFPEQEDILKTGLGFHGTLGILVVLILSLILIAQLAFGRLGGEQIRGDLGLKSGTPSASRSLHRGNAVLVQAYWSDRCEWRGFAGISL